VKQNPWLGIDPSQLRHRIVINTQTAGADSFNQPLLECTTMVRTTWAALNAVSMKEAFGEGQLTAQETDIWTVRWTPVQILPGMQLVFGSLVWKIQVVGNIARRNLPVHLLCLQLNTGS
jgi:head-tail adaptor